MAKNVATIHVASEASSDDFIDCLREQEERLGFELTFSQKGKWRSVHSESPRFPGEATDTALRLSREFVGRVLAMACFGDEIAAELFVEGRSKAVFSGQAGVRPKFNVNAWLDQGAGEEQVEELREAVDDAQECGFILGEAFRIPESSVLVLQGEFSLRAPEPEPQINEKVAAAMKAALLKAAKSGRPMAPGRGLMPTGPRPPRAGARPGGSFDGGDDPLASIRATLAKSAKAKPGVPPRPPARPPIPPRPAKKPAGKPGAKPFAQNDGMSLSDLKPVKKR